MNDSDVTAYLDGHRLYGDDFSPDEIAAWHADEREAYAGLLNKDAPYEYGYHALNTRHAYRHLRGPFPKVMSFGGAFGHELAPIISGVEHVTVADPSEYFVRPTVCGKPATYVKPGPTGALPLPDASFDLITCFGVLHHIPNVSFVVSELARALKPGGQIAIREPIVSMGDWRRPRHGLTKRERGIPLHLLQGMLRGAGLTVTRKSLCCFSLTDRIFTLPFSSPVACAVDELMCAAFTWNLNYHPRNTLQRFRAISAFVLANKEAAPR